MKFCTYRNTFVKRDKENFGDIKKASAYLYKDFCLRA